METAVRSGDPAATWVAIALAIVTVASIAALIAAWSLLFGRSLRPE